MRTTIGRIVCGLTAAVVMCSAGTALAATLTPSEHVKQVTRTAHFGGATGDEFGADVAIDGDWAVVGAPEFGPGGMAFVYRRTDSAWVYHQALPATPGAGDRFGAAVDVNGDFVLVGAPEGDGSVANSGYALLFKRSGTSWLLEDTYLPDADAADDEFGAAVAVGTQHAMVGCPLSDEVAGGSGSVYTFFLDSSASLPRYKCIADGLGANSQFGASLDAAGDFFIAGAPLDDSGPVPDAGTARLWSNPLDNIWSEVTEFQSPDRHSNDGFGHDVAISARLYTPGASVLVGSPRYDVGTAVDSGRVDIWRSNGSTWSWSEAKMLQPGSSNARFGESLEAEGAFAAVGMPGFAGTLGAAEVYSDAGGTWTLLAMLTRTVAADTLYGYSVAVDSRGRGVAGCLYGDGIAADAGSAYFFTRREPIFRFYNPGAGTHFLTPSQDEALDVIAKWPTIWTYEGWAYETNPHDNTTALHRFYNGVSQSHFYTASAEEAANVRAKWPHIFSYDGLTYAVCTSPGTGRVPIYRFFNVRNGSHFYTASEAERDQVRNTLGAIYQYEGPAFWVAQ